MPKEGMLYYESNYKLQQTRRREECCIMVNAGANVMIMSYGKYGEILYDSKSKCNRHATQRNVML